MRPSLSLSVRRSVSSAASRVLSLSGVIVCGVLLMLFTCSLCAWVLVESRSDAYNHAEENARNLMLVIERDIARNIELYDLSLQAVVDAGLPERTTPIAAERSAERQAAKMRELDERRANQLAAKARIHAAAEATQNRAPPWGTKEAKRLEIERVRQEIERRKKD